MDRFIEKDDWKNFFDFVSKMAVVQHVELEIAGLDVGDQIEKDWVTFEGISYDPRSDVLHVHTDPLDHSIRTPSSVVTVEDGSQLRFMLVKDTEGRSQILKFRRPLLLEGAPEIGMQISN